jgi:hypothetical protein
MTPSMGVIQSFEIERDGHPLSLPFMTSCCLGERIKPYGGPDCIMLLMERQDLKLRRFPLRSVARSPR